ncbi:MAG: leucyl aminopeptidase, partial [Lachnospiraceae bacterium]|nr:leucyl aminopeptidase [Lachnospiraceae bacterium]
MEERYSLSLGRIRELAENPEIAAPYDDYFRQMALFLLKMDGLYQWVKGGHMKEASRETLEGWNEDLYKDIMPLHYECSYANPDFSVAMLGDQFGRILSLLYTELRGEIVYAYEQRLFNLVILNELFLEVYSIMKDENPSYRQVKEAIYWFFSDYSEVTVRERIGEQFDKEGNYAIEIIMNADLTDLRYLYAYGEYISENEIKMAEYMNSLSEEQIHDLAFTYTDGYREGFSVMGIDISKKRLVEIRYQIGMERMIREAIKQFKAINLDTVVYRNAVSAMHRNPKGRVGYVSTSPNRQ